MLHYVKTFCECAAAKVAAATSMIQVTPFVSIVEHRSKLSRQGELDVMPAKSPSMFCPSAWRAQCVKSFHLFTALEQTFEIYFLNAVRRHIERLKSVWWPFLCGRRELIMGKVWPERRVK